MNEAQWLEKKSAAGRPEDQPLQPEKENGMRHTMRGMMLIAAMSVAMPSMAQAVDGCKILAEQRQLCDSGLGHCMSRADFERWSWACFLQSNVAAAPEACVLLDEEKQKNAALASSASRDRIKELDQECDEAIEKKSELDADLHKCGKNYMKPEFHTSTWMRQCEAVAGEREILRAQTAGRAFEPLSGCDGRYASTQYEERQECRALARQARP